MEFPPGASRDGWPSSAFPPSKKNLGREVGRLVLKHIIDAELAAIERATAKYDQREVQELCSLVLSS